MSTVPVSGSGATTLTATANLTVTRPRIERISISGYRAFPPGSPSSFDIDLGSDGKNLLLFGENGSGKTSLFRAIRDLCDTSSRQRDYAEGQNVFSSADDDSIVIKLTQGTPDEFRWEIGEEHPKANGGDSFRAFAGSCLALDYRDLLQTNFVNGVENFL